MRWVHKVWNVVHNASATSLPFSSSFIIFHHLFSSTLDVLPYIARRTENRSSFPYTYTCIYIWFAYTDTYTLYRHTICFSLSNHSNNLQGWCSGDTRIDQMDQRDITILFVFHCVSLPRVLSWQCVCLADLRKRYGTNGGSGSNVQLFPDKP